LQEHTNRAGRSARLFPQIWPSLSARAEDGSDDVIVTQPSGGFPHQATEHKKNGIHYFKKSYLDGGLNMFDFCTFNNTLKMNWAKGFLQNPTSVWNFIPHYILFSTEPL